MDIVTNCIEFIKAKNGLLKFIQCSNNFTRVIHANYDRLINRLQETNPYACIGLMRITKRTDIAKIPDDSPVREYDCFLISYLENFGKHIGIEDEIKRLHVSIIVRAGMTHHDIEAVMPYLKDNDISVNHQSFNRVFIEGIPYLNYMIVNSSLAKFKLIFQGYRATLEDKAFAEKHKRSDILDYWMNSATSSL
jgi:hypothetical protein